mmetsp:Transcript_40236/g.74996  ORF Transcript_40236/g.74996 Transcript_40236/m.74996 type:complete len:203 (+) Transcript_40236:28-636(+)
MSSYWPTTSGSLSSVLRALRNHHGFSDGHGTHECKSSSSAYLRSQIIELCQRGSEAVSPQGEEGISEGPNKVRIRSRWAGVTVGGPTTVSTRQPCPLSSHTVFRHAGWKPWKLRMPTRTMACASSSLLFAQPRVNASTSPTSIQRRRGSEDNASPGPCKGGFDMASNIPCKSDGDASDPVSTKDCRPGVTLASSQASSIPAF